MHVKPPFRRKSTLQRFVDSVGDQVGGAASHIMPDLHAMKPGKAVKTGLITAAGLTAGSAAISSLRQRVDQERSDS
ncbi:MAG TPA: hypothetical protein VFY45_01315 [Baekduia sp.]|nr:hypothetical protein [Baekduia sp.]